MATPARPDWFDAALARLDVLTRKYRHAHVCLEHTHYLLCAAERDAMAVPLIRALPTGHAEINWRGRGGEILVTVRPTTIIITAWGPRLPARTVYDRPGWVTHWRNLLEALEPSATHQSPEQTMAELCERW